MIPNSELSSTNTLLQCNTHENLLGSFCAITSRLGTHTVKDKPCLPFVAFYIRITFGTYFPHLSWLLILRNAVGLVRRLSISRGKEIYTERTSGNIENNNDPTM